MRFVLKSFGVLISLVIALVIATGVAGGIMYINEKLKSFGTIWLGG